MADGTSESVAPPPFCEERSFRNSPDSRFNLPRHSSSRATRRRGGRRSTDRPGCLRTVGAGYAGGLGLLPFTLGLPSGGSWTVGTECDAPLARPSRLRRLGDGPPAGACRPVRSGPSGVVPSVQRVRVRRIPALQFACRRDDPLPRLVALVGSA